MKSRSNSFSIHHKINPKAFSFWRNLLLILILSGGSPVEVWAQSLTLLAGGDVVWPQAFNFSPYNHDATFFVPTLGATISPTHNPFGQLIPILQAADLAFVNLETPIAQQAKLHPLPWAPTFRAHPSLANDLKSAGIDLVSTANNHALDTGFKGIDETLAALNSVQILAAGTGQTLIQARRPALVERHHIRVALLAYTQPDNSLIGYATPTQAGVAPLTIEHILSDIQALRAPERPKVNHVVVSLHWGQTEQRKPTATMRSIAHQIIDAGGDLILGHHPHLTQGIELYRGKPIIYSLGNLIFPYARPGWDDNMLVQVTLTPSQVATLEILPIAGKDPSRPHLLSGARAQRFLKQLQAQSAALNTSINIQGDRGFITIPQSLQPETDGLPLVPLEKIGKNHTPDYLDPFVNHPAR